MKAYKHIFFDLDRTLWDFEANTTETLRDIYVNENLKERGIPTFEMFRKTYRQINHDLWQQYKADEITKDYLKTERFYRTLKYFHITDYPLAEKAGEDYLAISKTKKKIFPGSISILQYLQTKYHLHIITNGFNEVQFDKLKNTGLFPFFEAIITSEEAGTKKPEKGIFNYALNLTGAQPSESLVVGDDPESDIMGARNSGIDQVYVNYTAPANGVDATFEVHHLESLKDFL